MFRQAILAPCCGTTFCSECVIDRLTAASVENSRCPGCRKEVYAHQLVPNEDIRKQVDKITRASKANTLALEKERELAAAPPEQAKSSEVDTSLKDKVNKPIKTIENGAAAATGSTAPVQAPPSIDPSWQPLGFGPLLSPEQFAEWQRLARSGLPIQAKERFGEWQRQVIEALPPEARPPPSKEAFE